MSNIKENIEQFIDAIKGGDYNQAEGIFSGLVDSKLQDRLEAEKVAVAGSIFNGDDEDLDIEEFEDEFDLEEVDE